MPIAKTFTVTIPVTYKIRSSELGLSREATLADALTEALARLDRGDKKNRAIDSAEAEQE